MRAEPGRPVDVRVRAQVLEDLLEVLAAEVRRRELGGPEVRRAAAGREDEHPIAEPDALDAVRDDDHRAAAVGERPQQLHQAALVTRVESRGRLVEEEERWLRQQLDRDADPLPLPARDLLDRNVPAPFEPELAHHLVDALQALLARYVRRKPELGRVLERARDRQLAVENVVLRDDTDALAQLLVVRIEIAAAVEDEAALSRPQATQGPEQGRLAASRRTDDADEGALAQAEADVLDERAAVDLDRQSHRLEADLAGVDVLLERVADEPEDAMADADDIELLQARLLDQPAVDEGPVVAAEVGELIAARREPVQLGVVARDEQVVEDDVVLRCPADPDEPGGLVDGAQPAEGVSPGRGCLRLGRSLTGNRGERRQLRGDRRRPADIEVAVLAFPLPRRRWCHRTVVSRQSARVKHAARGHS